MSVKMVVTLSFPAWDRDRGEIQAAQRFISSPKSLGYLGDFWRTPSRIKARHIVVTPGLDALESILKRCGIVLEAAQVETSVAISPDASRGQRRS